MRPVTVPSPIWNPASPFRTVEFIFWCSALAARDPSTARSSISLPCIKFGFSQHESFNDSSLGFTYTIQKLERWHSLTPRTSAVPNTKVSSNSSYSFSVSITTRPTAFLIVFTILSALSFDIGAHASTVRHSVPRIFTKSCNT